ncbi:MAG: hypothetical protein D6780_01840 [Candidatus Dadabacteria bacterium]|nr:MAG: hypothetical protein D6780_01840 [Candidatus Dadabacteria bacterium]
MKIARGVSVVIFLVSMCVPVSLTAQTGDTLECDVLGLSQTKKRFKRFSCQEDCNSDGVVDLTAFRKRKKKGNRKRRRRFKYCWDGETGELISKTRVKRKRNNSDSGGDSGSSDGLRAVCKNIRSIRRGEIYKSTGSPHFTDARRFSTGFIIVRGVSAPSVSCILVYDKNGNKVHSMGIYARGERDWAARYYGASTRCSDGQSGRSVASKAKRNTGKPTVYLKISSRECIEIPDASQCYNSRSC